MWLPTCIFLALSIIDIFKIHSTEARRNYIGTVCSVDQDCGVNEVCKIPKLYQPLCLKGYCECQLCFTNTTATSPCELVYVERPCDLECVNGTVSHQECDDWCENSPPLRILTPNSHCQYFSYGQRSRRVLCNNCYESRNRQCERIMNTGFGYECDSDCSCESNLKCNGRCMCLTTNEHWHADMLACERRELEDECTSDRDCDVDPDDTNFRWRGQACVNSKCQCGTNLTMTDVTYYDSNGDFTTERICVSKDAVVNLGDRDVCNFGDIYDALQPTARLCAADFICWSCGQNNPTKICRTVIPVPKNDNEQCNGTTIKVYNDEAEAKIGMACDRDDDCGKLEVCSKPSVTPPCLEGSCKCKKCHDVGPDGYCVPVQNLAIGDRCSNIKGTELYPLHASCQKNVVHCDTYYKQYGKKCIPDEDSFAKPGETCSSSENCFGVLVCSASVVTTSSMHKEPRHCGCKTADNQRWDRDKQVCAGPQLGDGCFTDAGCTSLGLLPPTAQPRVCIGERCSCRPEDISYNGECYAATGKETCPHCPEDDNDAPCRTAYVVEEDTREKQENCIVELSKSLYKIETKTSSTSCMIEDNLETHSVGKPCLIEEECGYNEICFHQGFSPTCQYGRCACKDCHDIGPDNLCAPLAVMKFGGMCFNSAREIYIQSEDDLWNMTIPLRCDEGIVRCNHCYYFDERAGKCVRSEVANRSEGDNCQHSCQCLGDGDMICSSGGKCKCHRATHGFDVYTMKCVPRTYFSSCSSDENCNDSGYTTKGGKCVRGHCICAKDYKYTTTGLYNGTSIVNRQICYLARARSYIRQQLGSTCILDPLRNTGSFLSLANGVCEEGMTCINCDGTYDPPPFSGRCREIDKEGNFTQSRSRQECVAELIRWQLLNSGQQLFSAPSVFFVILIAWCDIMHFHLRI